MLPNASHINVFESLVCNSDPGARDSKLVCCFHFMSYQNSSFENLLLLMVNFISPTPLPSLLTQGNIEVLTPRY